MWKDQSERDIPCSIMMLQAEKVLLFSEALSFGFGKKKKTWSLGATHPWCNANQRKYMLFSWNVERLEWEGHSLFNNDVASRKSAVIFRSSFIWILVKRHGHFGWLTFDTMPINENKYCRHGMWQDQGESNTPCSIMMLQAEKSAFMVGSSFIWMLVKRYCHLKSSCLPQRQYMSDVWSVVFQERGSSAFQRSFPIERSRTSSENADVMLKNHANICMHINEGYIW